MNAEPDPIWDRLEERISNFNRQSETNKRLYQYIKLGQIVSGAAVTFAAAIEAQPLVTAGVGGLIIVLEGIQQLFSYHERWLRFRQTCERLRREKHLFLSKAEHYAGASDARAVLAARIEAILAWEVDIFASVEDKRVSQ